MSGGMFVSRCLICRVRLACTRILCTRCLKPLRPGWQPKSAWGRARKAERERLAVIGGTP